MKCKCCGNKLSINSTCFVTEDGDLICMDCFNRHYEKCKKCGAVVKRGKNLCESCIKNIFKTP